MGNNDGVGVAEANGQEEHEREDEAERMEEDDANSNTDGDEDAESESEDDDEDEEDDHHEERIAEAQKNVAANPYDYNGHLKVRRLGLSNANRLTSCAVNDTVFYQQHCARNVFRVPIIDLCVAAHLPVATCGVA